MLRSIVYIIALISIFTFMSETQAAQVSPKAAAYLGPFWVSPSGLDTNAGTQAAPFKTLTKAQTAMRQSSAVKTTYLRAGNYTPASIRSCFDSMPCGLKLTAADNGTTWTIAPTDNINTAIITGGSTSQRNGLWSIIQTAGTTGVVINGLTFKNFIFCAICSDFGNDTLTVSNNVISNGFGAQPDSSPSGIACYSCTNLVASHNVIHDIAQLGISLVGGGTGDISHARIDGNAIYNTCTADKDCGAIYIIDYETGSSTDITVSNNYIRDGATFPKASEGLGGALYADDCASNILWTGNVVTGRNGAFGGMIHGGSNVRYIGNLFDIYNANQSTVVLQGSDGTGCSSQKMSGNQITNNIVIGSHGGGSYPLFDGSPRNSPTIKNNDYFAYNKGPALGAPDSYKDAAPSKQDPKLSCWIYNIDSSSLVLKAPVSFPGLTQGWGPPGYVIPQTGTAPSSPHTC